MKAITYSRYGNPEVLQLEEIPAPIPGEDEVLVRVHAASVNSWDRDNLWGKWINRIELGLLRPKIPVLGGDIAGVVESVGPGVSTFKPGDEVFGDLSRAGWGAFAEYARAPATALARKPAELSFEQAAAMPQCAVIARQGIVEHGRVRSGQRVLINGAGGGVGSYAVQLAKNAGAEVTGVDSAMKLDMLLELGTDHVLDYRSQDYTTTGERYDFILDCEVHRSLNECRRALAPGGHLTMVGGSNAQIFQVLIMGPWLRLRSEQRMGLLLHEANRKLSELGELAAAGELASVIGHTYPLAETPAAMQRMCDAETIGKTVITVV